MLSAACAGRCGRLRTFLKRDSPGLSGTSGIPGGGGRHRLLWRRRQGLRRAGRDRGKNSGQQTSARSSYSHVPWLVRSRTACRDHDQRDAPFAPHHGERPQVQERPHLTPALDSIISLKRRALAPIAWLRAFGAARSCTLRPAPRPGSIGGEGDLAPLPAIPLRPMGRRER